MKWNNIYKYMKLNKNVSLMIKNLIIKVCSLKEFDTGFWLDPLLHLVTAAVVVWGVLGAFNQEKALVGASPWLWKLRRILVCSSSGDLTWSVSRGRSGWRGAPGRWSWPARSACWAGPSCPLQLSPHHITLHLGNRWSSRIRINKDFKN